MASIPAGELVNGTLGKYNHVDIIIQKKLLEDLEESLKHQKQMYVTINLKCEGHCDV